MKNSFSKIDCLYVIKIKLFFLQLMQPLEINGRQFIVELPTRDINDNDAGFVYGWGLMSYPNRVYPRQLQKAQMIIFPTAICLDMFNFEMHDGQFCAYNQEGIGTCIVRVCKYCIILFFYFT
jgi:hypothetical protein